MLQIFPVCHIRFVTWSVPLISPMQCNTFVQFCSKGFLSAAPKLSDHPVRLDKVLDEGLSYTFCFHKVGFRHKDSNLVNCFSESTGIYWYVKACWLFESPHGFILLSFILHLVYL